MSTLVAATIGAGSIADTHGRGYTESRGVELRACADLVRNHAEEFADEWGIDADGVYRDYETMLREVEPDIVSVCTTVPSHAEIVIGVARTGIPSAIHCEKPMAQTWGGAQRMAHECRRRGIALTFDHQRRFGTPARRAKELLDKGEIGSLERIEIAGAELFDWGTHLIDLANFFNDERPAEWVMGQVDYREENRRFGIHLENHSLANWEWDNGVSGWASMGVGSSAISDIKPGLRIRGDGGTIELFGPPGPPGPHEVARVRRHGDDDWVQIDAEGDGFHRSGEYVDVPGHSHIERAIQDVVTAVREGSRSELCAENALKATEIYFGAYESSRRRARVEFPLDIDDNPLEAMVEAGDLTPATSQSE